MVKGKSRETVGVANRTLGRACIGLKCNKKSYVIEVSGLKTIWKLRIAWKQEENFDAAVSFVSNKLTDVILVFLFLCPLCFSPLFKVQELVSITKDELTKSNGLQQINTYMIFKNLMVRKWQVWIAS